MTQTTFQSNPVQFSGGLPQVGNKTPGFTLTDGDLDGVINGIFTGKKVVYSIFLLVDTSVCVASVRHPNEGAAELDNAVVVDVFRDLPFVLDYFCAAEGLDNVKVASGLRHGSDEASDVVQQDSLSASLFVRAVVVADKEGKVIYNQLIDEVTAEPDYDSALATLK